MLGEGTAVRSTTCAVSSCVVACLALVATGASAAAAPKPITGKLSKPGYDVIALAAGGRATTVHVTRGRFRLVPPAASVSLHLRAPNGSYAGPLVVARAKRGKRVILGVRAGARLGNVTVRSGFAKVETRLARRSIDESRTARARKGVPIGARGFGRVRSRPLRASAAQTSAGQDEDSDGIPNALDIDDNGNLVLDNFERSNRARAAQADGAGAPLYLSSVMSLVLSQTVNANAPGFTDDQIDPTLSSLGHLMVSVLPGGPAELDCGGQPDPSNPDGWLGGLPYCTRGGTGTAAFGFGFPGQPPFPGPAAGQLDVDGDGLGDLGTSPCQPGAACSHGVQLRHGATPAGIKTGQTVLEHVSIGVAESQCPPPAGTLSDSCASFSGTLQFVFTTVSALVSYRDGAGNCAKVEGTPGDCPTVFSYPVAAGGAGTDGHGFPVAPCPPGAPAPCVEGHVVLSLTFWRPQRTRIANDPAPEAGESGTWTDIGHLTYTAASPVNGLVPFCPEGAFSPMDASLTPVELPLTPAGQGGLADSADDQPASQAHTVSYALDVTQCLAAKGLSWESGQEQTLNFQGTTLRDAVNQLVNFKRQ
jgi:hypothetical protein